MKQKNESCRIIEEGGMLTVALRPKGIMDSLKGKLSDEFIAQGNEIVSRQLSLNSLHTMLHRQCNNVKCGIREQSPFRGVPSGKQNADIMFLSKQPTVYEACNMSTHCDREGVFLSLILSKMGIDRMDIYCTDMIKCHATPDETSCRECIMQYLNNEIVLVQPKLIICNGLAVLKACGNMGVFTDLTVDASYGTIYDVTTLMNMKVKTIAIYDLNRVLMKQGKDYDDCNNKLFNQLKSAFNSLEV